MTDLHTHILPGMDDGARNVEESLEMLRMEWAQGVHTVVLTPHYYCADESIDRFLARRAEAYQRLTQHIEGLPPEERAQLPHMILGAEVTWDLSLFEREGLERLCIEGTKNMLFELPFTVWNKQTFDRLYDLIGQTGIVPVLAHLDRYIKLQKRDVMSEVFELGVPVQVSCEILTQPLLRGKVMKLLERRRAHLLASDCHDCTRRPPNLEAAVDVLRRKLGDWRVEELLRSAEELTGAQV